MGSTFLVNFSSNVIFDVISTILWPRQEEVQVLVMCFESTGSFLLLTVVSAAIEISPRQWETLWG